MFELTSKDKNIYNDNKNTQKMNPAPYDISIQELVYSFLFFLRMRSEKIK